MANAMAGQSTVSGAGACAATGGKAAASSSTARLQRRMTVDMLTQHKVGQSCFQSCLHNKVLHRGGRAMLTGHSLPGAVFRQFSWQSGYACTRPASAGLRAPACEYQLGE